MTAAAGERLADVLAEVRRIEVPGSRLLTDVLSGGYRSTFRGLGVEFSEVREYVEGDDPRSVDWNVTARVGRPFVKRFVEERERTLIFVLDLAPTLAHGLGAWSPRQVASRYAALLGLMAIDNHDRVGLVAGGADEQRFVLPQPGGGHVLRVLRDCVHLPAAATADLPALLGTVSARVRRRAVVIVLSDFLRDGYQRALSLCGRHHDVVAVRIHGRERVAPPKLLLRVVGPGDARPVTCDFRNERFRRAWLERVAADRHRHDEAVGRAGVDGIDVEIPAERDIRLLSAPLLSFLRRREGRR